MNFHKVTFWKFVIFLNIPKRNKRDAVNPHCQAENLLVGFPSFKAVQKRFFFQQPVACFIRNLKSCSRFDHFENPRLHPNLLHLPPRRVTGASRVQVCEDSKRILKFGRGVRICRLTFRWAVVFVFSVSAIGSAVAMPRTVDAVVVVAAEFSWLASLSSWKKLNCIR